MAAGLPCHTALEFFQKSALSAICHPFFSPSGLPRLSPRRREPCRAEKNNESCKEILFFFA
jgi:hypothetical protein